MPGGISGSKNPALKPMVCMRVAFDENDGNHENDRNDEDKSERYKQGVECWTRGNHGGK